MNLLTKAYQFASEKHKSQTRKNRDKTPYINHPIEVANLIANIGNINDQIVLIAALLHDTLEDTKTTKEEIKNEFSETILNIVLEVTDDKSLLKMERKKHQIDHAKYLSNEAKLIKLGDKISNLNSTLNDPPENWSDDDILGYTVWSKQVIDNIRGVNKDLEDYYDYIYETIFKKYNRRLDEEETILKEYFK